MSTTEVREELGKFFTVSARQFEAGAAAPEMFSTVIDAEWHRLLDSPEYVPFSTIHAGQILGHVENKGTGPISWITAYEEMHGPLPVIWFTREDGTVDEAALKEYRETGAVVAEWDCSPTGGDGDDFTPKRQKAATR